MKELNQSQHIIFILGGVLMVIGAVLFAMFLFQRISCWIMLVGAILFAAMQYEQKYLGSDIVVRRLRRIMMVSAVCLVAAGLFMVEDAYHFLKPIVTSNLNNNQLYLKVFHHNWVVLLLIGAILEIYSTQRLNSELKQINPLKKA